MKVTKIVVKNYRCLKDFTIDVDDYAVLIGPNGAGKSSLLYALRWFFDGGQLESTDIHAFTNADETARYTDEQLQTDPSLDTIEVTVTFSDLTDRDKKKLGPYGRGATATFRRSWRLSENKEKVVGNALQGPGFADIRAMKTVGEFRPAYNNLQKSQSELPALTGLFTMDQIEDAFAEWENKPENIEQLVPITNADANHLFGFNGPNIIKECIMMVLIPASGDIVQEVGLNKKGSALNELIGTLMSNASAAARQAWIDKHSTEIDELSESMRESVRSSTGFQAERINEKLASLVPNAEVDFNTNVPGWIPNPVATVRTDVTIDGTKNDVSRQGHGIQRAVMIAMFQSLMPDEKLVKAMHLAEDEETPEQAEARLQEILKDLPALLICIEEPEIYQHPVRARSFARVLFTLASQPNAQVFLATHSPYFVQPAQFESLRRFSLAGGTSTVKLTSVSELASETSLPEARVKKVIEMRLPSAFSEGFFSEAVALVEGGTDKVVLEAVAEKLDSPFDTAGISILDMSGKDGLIIPKTMLDKLGTPVYIVIDGDALGAARKYKDPSEQSDRDQAHNNHKNATEAILAWLPSSTATIGTLRYTFEDPTVVSDKYTIWNDDIEETLAGWPSFMSALSSIGGNLRSRKNLQAYKEAVMAARLEDMPEPIKVCVESILEFKS